MENNESVLKKYYAKYLVDVRGLKQSSVKHYYDALNNISRRLKEKNLVKKDIYEIADLDQLNQIREILYSDEQFVIDNERGRRMYSAGLNNYCRFAQGEGFHEIQNYIVKLDVPMEPESAILVEQSVWKRSGILRKQVIEFAGYQCEIDNTHETFISECTKKPYMEGHHALPMNLQDEFNVSLDVYANIVCMCPICHRRIHYGVKSDRTDLANQIYEKRSDRMVSSGIKLSKSEFVNTVLGA